MPDGPLPREALAGMFAHPVQQRFVRRLARRPGQWVLMGDLVNAVYGDREDGGPDWAVQVLRAGVHKLKPHLASSGWRIEGRRGCVGGYRLVLA